MRTAGVPFAAGAGLSAIASTHSLTLDFQRGEDAWDSGASRAGAGACDGVASHRAGASPRSPPFE